MTAEDGNTTITIDVGKRALCGDVRVNNAKLVNEAVLIEFLTTPQVDGDAIPTFVESQSKVITKWVNAKGSLVSPAAPAWQRGKPFPRSAQKPVQEIVKAGLKSLGFAALIHEVSIQIPDDAPVATLLIEIIDEGPRARRFRKSILKFERGVGAKGELRIELEDVAGVPRAESLVCVCLQSKY